jgi:hypothetical protein
MSLVLNHIYKTSSVTAVRLFEIYYSDIKRGKCKNAKESRDIFTRTQNGIR